MFLFHKISCNWKLFFNFDQNEDCFIFLNFSQYNQEMKLTDCFLRLTNHIRFQRVPGNILIGKHRIWPKLTSKTKRYLLNRIDIELNNMKCISRSFMSKEEESEALKTERLFSEEKIKDKIPPPLNKNKMNDKLFEDHFIDLKLSKKWE